MDRETGREIYEKIVKRGKRKKGSGGARAGAGRKKIGENKMITVTGRMTKQQKQALWQAGGFKAIRHIINFCYIWDCDLRQFIDLRCRFEL